MNSEKNEKPLEGSRQSPSPVITSPLRLRPKSPKDKSPHGHLDASSPSAPISRRQSNSYKHLKQNNLVSKSPFKVSSPTTSPPPVPTTTKAKFISTRSPISPGSSHTQVYNPAAPNLNRRVSAEKRRRTQSMQVQAEVENDRPSAYKRRQSKGLNGLSEKEHVSRSPFRKRTANADANKLGATEAAPVVETAAKENVNTSTAANGNGSSPARSSLVSRRLHGPRVVGSTGRRSRRKTVTWDERCDVVEFEWEEEEGDEGRDGNVFESDTNDSDVVDGQEHWDPPLPSPDQDEDEPLSATLSSLLCSERKADDLDNGAGLPNTSADTSILSQEKDLPPSPGREEVRENNGVTGPGGSFALGDSHSREDSRLSIGSFQASLRLSGLGLGLGLDDLYPKLGAETPDTDISKGGIRPATGDTFRGGINIRHSSPAPRSRTNSFGKDERGGDGKDGTDAHERESDDGNTSYSSCEDVDLSTLLDEAQKGDKKDLPVMQRGDSPRSGGFTPQTMTPTAPSPLAPDASSPPPRPPSTARMTSPLTPNQRILSRTGASPRARSLSSPAAPSSNAAGVEESSGAGRSVESPTLGLRVRPRIDRERLRRRLRDRANQLNASVNSEASVGDESQTDVADESLCLDQAEGRLKNNDDPGVEKQERVSMLSLSPSFVAESATATIETAQKLVVSTTTASPVLEEGTIRAPLPMRRSQNFTHDGVLELDPEPQEIDPPRPAMAARAGTDSQIERGEFNPGLGFNFGNGLSLELGKAAPDAYFEDGSVGKDGVELGDVKSALDRLMDDVAGANVSGKAHTKEVREGDDSMGTELDDSFGMSLASPQDVPDQPRAQAVPAQTIERTSTDTALEPGNGLSRTVSDSSIGPPVPPKPLDARKQMEMLILEKRRQIRRMEQSMDDSISPPRLDVGIGPRKRSIRPVRRRSRSTGDVRNGEVADLAMEGGDLGTSIEQELRKLAGGAQKGKYRVREHQRMIYASSSHDDVDRGDNIGHVSTAGDLDGGRAWRTLRRPSDMNEYSRQIKELRSQEKQGKVHGKVFVRVLGVKGMQIPIPAQTTAITCTLNNGIHYVTTPECKLVRDCKIDQEFELIEHNKLEFTLTLKVRRDTHIISQFKSLAAPPPIQAPPVPASKGGGMRSFFGASKKVTKNKPTPATAPATPPLPESLARYLKPDGTLARAFIVFKDIASHCDTKLFETSFPLIGQKMEPGGVVKSMEMGEIDLQIFRLPPLPGLSHEQLPQSLDECQRGLRHTNWHKVTYFEGVLTQNGGDCVTWRRRHFRVIGANLVAYNDVTKKAISTIDLKKAVAAQDDQELKSEGLSRHTDEYDGLYGVERSFRLIFNGDQEITFFADTDEDKSRWLGVFKALIGHVPPNPLWGELVWQQQDDAGKKSRASEDAHALA